jgi:glycine dehydrogenase
MPPVIRRTIFENPSWYTSYTPYQPEISQGRLEALLNFQSMIVELTGLDIANASLLDEATAAAEAVGMALAKKKSQFSGECLVFVSSACNPQTIAVIQSRLEALSVRLALFHSHDQLKKAISKECAAVVVSSPDTYGRIEALKDLVELTHQSAALFISVSDPLALALLKTPKEAGVDIAVGSTQRFGIPLGFGGPHAAYIACKDELKRLMPGRLVGVSRDARGEVALRLALQTREQHIRREKATSNICTSQALLAIMAGMYGLYHGADGLQRIALDVNKKAHLLAEALRSKGIKLLSQNFFDTLHISFSKEELVSVKKRAESARVNLRYIDDSQLTLSLDEATTSQELDALYAILTGVANREISSAVDKECFIDKVYLRSDDPLKHAIFSRYRSESELLRYIKKLEKRDYSLADGMIPLGSCTMKLNAASELFPVSWPEFSSLHPFVPLNQAQGYLDMINELEKALCDMTGFAAVSLQPNAGSQGELAGLLALRAYFKGKKEGNRKIVLIPTSAHGTNPASAAMAGFQVVTVECEKNGDVSREDLKKKLEQYRDQVAAIMVTYPSTHGVFEDGIIEIASLVHGVGGQVYLDGANLNALVGVAKPAQFGADLCHINLHKTFCIPHGGGGPGVGPVAVAKHLIPFLPQHPLKAESELKERGVGAVAAAIWGSASILPISWMYVAMMAGSGLTKASQVAILHSNYIAKRLEGSYKILYKNPAGFVAHECIVDLRGFKESAGIEAEDVAKRLIDYGFHAPTLSWPVAGTIMIEPTESESLGELERFIEAMLSIRQEISEIERGEQPREINVLKAAPHTADLLISCEWNRPYSREKAAYPIASLKQNKFWPQVARLDGVYGDRHLFCACVA